MEADKFLLDENIKAADRKFNIENIVSKALTAKINRTMLIHLAPKNPHLLHTEVDFEPRLEASWWMGGINPSNSLRKYRKSVKFLKNCVDETVDLSIQYFGQPIMHLRHKHPLREIIPLNDCENPA